jgi:glycosyltransferase involved in cell wall biosynthesis
MVGNYTGAKGQEQLISTIDLAKIESATVLLVGKNFRDRTSDLATELKKQIEALSARSHGRKRVVCLELDRAETVEAFFAAELFMLLSQIECSPLVLFEAAAAATPFIASDVGNSREIADWTGAGLIAPGKLHESGLTFVDVAATAELVEKLYADPGRRRAMAESGRRTVLERFTWDRVVDQYEALYAQIANMKAMSRAS